MKSKSCHPEAVRLKDLIGGKDVLILRLFLPSLVFRLTVVLMLGFAGPAWAQTAPDAGSILRDLNRTTPQLTKPPTPAEPFVPEGQGPVLKQGQAFLVKDFSIRATLFPEAVLKEVVADYVGRACTLGDLQEAAAKIGQYYRDHDILARAYLPQQTIRGGIVAIVVLEGRLGKLSVESADPAAARLRPEVAAGTVLARQPEGEVVRPSALADGLAALNALPGVKATAVLESGTDEALTDLRVRVEDTALVSGVAQLDNASARSVGQARAVVSSAVNDAAGFGDQTTLTAVKSQGSDYGRLSLSAPVGYSGLTLGINGSALHYAVGARINVSRPDGDATTLGASATYPLYRSQSAVMQAQASYDHKRMVNVVSDQTISNNHLDVASLGVSGSATDDWVGGGIDGFALAGSLGRLDWASNPGNLSHDYGKATATASRTAPVLERTEVMISAAGQWAAKNLDSSEKFALGGPTAIRAYPVNEASGDEGILATVEVRHSPVEDVMVSAFFDVGISLQQVRPWANTGPSTPNCYSLEGTGVAASWSPTAAIQMKATLAQRIGSNPGADAAGHDSDGKHERTRLWLQLSSTF